MPATRLIFHGWHIGLVVVVYLKNTLIRIPIDTLNVHSDNFITENQERFYLYLIISVTAAVLLCLTLVIGRLIVRRKRNNNTKNGDGKFEPSNSGETSLPPGFSDDISEIDADIDLATPISVSGIASISKNEVSHTQKKMVITNIFRMFTRSFLGSCYFSLL